MSIQKAEMSVEQIENGQYVEQVAYPFVEYDHVAMENGMDIMSMIRDDVSTPTITHNTTNWKVGKGDSDVSESIVDSSVGDITIKGQTYQNILPSPSLRNSMTNGKTMQKLNEGYDSVNTVDGVCKSAILKGQTLVNLFDKKASEGSFKQWDTISQSRHTLTQGQKVTLKINVLELNGKFELKAFGDGFEDWYWSTSDVGEYSVLITVKNDGVFKLRANQNLSCKLEYVLIEGDYTNVDIPYFTGMKSVRMPVLTTTGKNLFDMTRVGEDLNKINPVIIGNNSLTITATTLYHNNYKYYPITFKPNTRYTLSAIVDSDSSLVGTVLGFRYTDGTFSYISKSQQTLTSDANKTVECIAFSYGNNGIVETWSNIQLEEASTATTYEPYKTNILTVNEDVTLRSNGSVYDELDLLTGKLTQRIDEDGSVLTQEVVKTVDLSILDQDNQPTTQLNSFANGYIQVSSQGLIPSVDYEVPTSNSYHVDLMKPNTQYTMKNMQGAFTIDNIQYNASTNGTFTSPSALTNKLMITNVVQTQPMLLEGDMTSKEVPYVEGIKSAFEGADKVEIYSVGENLFDFTNSGLRDESTYDKGMNGYGFWSFAVQLQPNKEVTISRKNSDGYNLGLNLKVHNENNYNGGRWLIANHAQNENKNFTTLSTNSDGYIWLIFSNNFNKINQILDICEYIKIEYGRVATPYEPYKSNTTLFQLSNPLRSLPNGVRDEIILDRVNHKARIIQRVGEDLTQLDTPIVTEVNLEGYPYVYKGGHIFLNTEIAPITEVTYSINQAHQIESSNEDILRHQNEINHLYELIAQYVQVHYEAELIDIAL